MNANEKPLIPHEEIHRGSDFVRSLKNDFENCKNRLSQSPDWICEQFVSDRSLISWRLRLTG
jgi:hypothetical protein